MGGNGNAPCASPPSPRCSAPVPAPPKSARRRGKPLSPSAAAARALGGPDTPPSPALVRALVQIIAALFLEAHGYLPEDAPKGLASLRDDLPRESPDGWGWSHARSLFQWLHEAGAGALFAPIPDGALLRALDALLAPEGARLPLSDLDVSELGVLYEGLLALNPVDHRKRLGAHYTSRAIARLMAERTLAPLLGDSPSADAILDLRICDPAMGTGAFLIEVCRVLAERLAAAFSRTENPPDLPSGEDLRAHALRLVAERCLYGVDKDPLAVELARLSLRLLSKAPLASTSFAAHSLRHGDSLVGVRREALLALALDPSRPATSPALRALLEARLDAARTDPAAQNELRTVGDALLAAFFASRGRKPAEGPQGALPRHVEAFLLGHDEGAALPSLAAQKAHDTFHWDLEFPAIFARGGFDAFVGNPPWVSYAGKAAQPLDDDLRRLHGKTNPAFAGFRNLQGLFVRHCADLLRPSGRIGFVLPTSMSDLGGYEPTRRAHDELAACDDDLPDFGDVFEGVFQPSMGLLSTRRSAPITLSQADPWPLSRPHLDAESRALLDRLAALPKLPPHLFGERGFQTNGDDAARLHEREGPEDALPEGLRVGGDVEPFLRKRPRLYCDPRVFGARFRHAHEWQSVRLLIRQTARFPMVALSDGAAFRNSVLAAFEDDTFCAFFLLAWLNASPLRWYHYMRHRDARQGMPQMKITHLRALPAPPSDAHKAELASLGRALGERNGGIAEDEQRALDELACRALDLDERECATIARWAKGRPEIRYRR